MGRGGVGRTIRAAALVIGLALHGRGRTEDLSLTGRALTPRRFTHRWCWLGIVSLSDRRRRSPRERRRRSQTQRLLTGDWRSYPASRRRRFRLRYRSPRGPDGCSAVELVLYALGTGQLPVVELLRIQHDTDGPAASSDGRTLASPTKTSGSPPQPARTRTTAMQQCRRRDGTQRNPNRAPVVFRTRAPRPQTSRAGVRRYGRAPPSRLRR